MAIVTRRDFAKDIDTPKRNMDVSQRLLDEALVDKKDVKSTTLSRLHGLRTEVTYYEQIISNRQGNLANLSALNQIDPNTTRFRRIANFVILTEELESNLDKDVFTNLSYEGSGMILPSTVIPNVGDYFVMEVFKIFHIFRIVEVNPTLIEKDSGYEVRFDMFRQDIIPENCELNVYVKEDYTFDYNHVGTDFRTILRNDEYEFIQNCRNIMYDITKIYLGTFYHRTLNTIMCETGNLAYDVHTKMTNCVKSNPTVMIGTSLAEGRSIYDINLVSFINKHNVLSSSEYIHCITEHVKPDKNFYTKSIFSCIEHRDLTRFINRFQRAFYMNSNLYHHTNKLYGRFIIEHDVECLNNCSTFTLVPPNFVQKMTTYSSDTMLNATPTYTNANDLFIDIISTFVNEKNDVKRAQIIVKLMRLLFSQNHSNHLYDDDFTDSYLVFYTYPIVLYVLKYMAREVSQKEYK